MCLLAVVGSQGMVVKCTATIFFGMLDTHPTPVCMVTSSILFSKTIRQFVFIRTWRKIVNGKLSFLAKETTTTVDIGHEPPTLTTRPQCLQKFAPEIVLLIINHRRLRYCVEVLCCNGIADRKLHQNPQ